MKTAIVIDEEPYFSRVVSTALSLDGFDVNQFYDATSAKAFLDKNRGKLNEAIILIDMNLEPGDDHKSFGLEQTSNYLQTGIVLAEWIIRESIIPTEQRNNIILYSALRSAELWETIETFCQDNSIRMWQKRTDADLDEIIRLVSGTQDNSELEDPSS